MTGPGVPRSCECPGTLTSGRAPRHPSPASRSFYEVFSVDLGIRFQRGQPLCFLLVPGSASLPHWPGAMSRRPTFLLCTCRSITLYRSVHVEHAASAHSDLSEERAREQLPSYSRVLGRSLLVLALFPDEETEAQRA